MQSTHKVVTNTFILYGKMVITVAVMLLSTRILVSELGVADYGIYNLIAGMVALLAFLNGAMAASTQRFMSFHLGSGSDKHLKQVFAYSAWLHFVLGLILLILIEMVGTWLVSNKLEIPDDKVSVTILALHCLSFSTFLTVISVPYVATLISKENLWVLSIINIIELAIKLTAAGSLYFIVENKLAIYSMLMVAAPMMALILLVIYCHKNYHETRSFIASGSDKELFKSMLGFASWNFIGAATSAARSQGVAILMNLFFGVVVNAAYGIANQVNGLLRFFSTAMMQAIRPQIIKSEGANNRQRMLKLSMISCKFMFYISALFCIPLINEMSFVLSLWLTEVPQYTVIFCQLILIFTLITQFTQGIQVSIEAVGNIRLLQLIVGSLHIVNIPVGYILFKNGYSADTVLLAVVVEESICLFLRLIIARKVVDLNLWDYFKEVIIPTVPIFCAVFAVSYGICQGTNEGWIRMIANFAICGTIFPALVWFYGLKVDEKTQINGMCRKLLVKFKVGYAN